MKEARKEGKPLRRKTIRRRRKNFQPWFSEELEKRGFSLRELSRRSGIDSGYISRASKGKTSLSRDAAYKIADTLWISTTEFLEEIGHLGEFPYEIVEADEEIREMCRKLANEKRLTYRDKDAFLRLILAWQKVSVEEPRE